MKQKHRVLKVDNKLNSNIEISDLIDYELLSKLDSIKIQSLHNSHKLFSQIYSGGVAALSDENRKSNPDWMSQSANSFREILYALPKANNKKLQEVLTEYFNKSHTKEEVQKYKHYLSELYKLFTDIAHHFSGNYNRSERTYKLADGFIVSADNLDDNTYFEAIRLYKVYLKLMELTAIDIHKKIDKYIKDNCKNEKAIRIIINNSYDAKSYFFLKIDNSWLHWLWTHSFFAHLKKISADEKRQYNDSCELDYLRRMAKQEPDTVTKIIQSIPVSQKNSIIVFHIIWIMGDLPAHCIKVLIEKMSTEEWFSLTRGFQISGYDFTDIVNKTVSHQEPTLLLTLAHAMFTTISKEVYQQKKSPYELKSPFVISHMLDSDIFNAVSNIGENYIDEAFETLCSCMANILLLGKPSNIDTFVFSDIHSFYDIDIFSIDLGRITKSRNHKKDLYAFIATLKRILERLFSSITSLSKAEEIFGIIESLPSARLSWRIKLFALAQCPNYLHSKLRGTLFYIFESSEAFDLGGDTEYQKLLKCSFTNLSYEDQKLFVQNIFSYYSNIIKANPDKGWYKDIAWEILSCIASCLSAEDENKVETVFGRLCDKNYVPKPPLRDIRVGTVSYQSPENLAVYTVPEIIQNLKTEWKPEILKEKYKYDDHLNPRGAEGMSYALTSDIKLRLDDYLQNIIEFLNVADIDILYLNAVLRGVEELFRDEKPLNVRDAKLIFSFFKELVSHNEFLNIPEQERHDTYIPSLWTEINKICIKIVIYILQEKTTGKEIIKSDSDTIISLISYWFSFSHSPLAEEENQSPQKLHGIAINSVRSCAFEALVEFTFKHKVLTDKIKSLFNQALLDISLAVRFCIGRYLSTFFYKDNSYVVELLPHIFPLDNINKFIAAFSGYLSANLYIDIYEHMDLYYRQAIDVTTDEHDNNNTSSFYPSFDELLASHIALAFAFSNLEITDELFIYFWEQKNVTRHREFISYIGKSCLNKNHITEGWLEKKKVSKKKLLDFWNWRLENVTDEEILSGFDFWVNPKKEVIDDNILLENITKTLKKSGGRMGWDYGFVRRLPAFAKVNGSKTLVAISYYLLDCKGKINPNRHRPLYFNKEINTSLKIIYKSGTELVKQQTIDLINKLISQGSKAFWELEEIIK
ncbi:MAG: hypothetical protein EHM58_02450 [Ignavibacteriae bacterium]|nr:MAG: hypothetical protein EHM58_02450 [Ignavibacteriota bacterium]